VWRAEGSGEMSGRRKWSKAESGRERSGSGSVVYIVSNICTSVASAAVFGLLHGPLSPFSFLLSVSCCWFLFIIVHSFMYRQEEAEPFWNQAAVARVRLRGLEPAETVRFQSTLERCFVPLMLGNSLLVGLRSSGLRMDGAFSGQAGDEFASSPDVNNSRHFVQRTPWPGLAPL
jgi:hypothetical protein